MKLQFSALFSYVFGTDENSLRAYSELRGTIKAKSFASKNRKKAKKEDKAVFKAIYKKLKNVKIGSAKLRLKPKEVFIHSVTVTNSYGISPERMGDSDDLHNCRIRFFETPDFNGDGVSGDGVSGDGGKQKGKKKCKK